MPELPEILLRASEIDKELTNKVVTTVNLFQPNCLNISPEEFKGRIVGQRIEEASYRGKWIIVRLTHHYLLLHLGMGGEILYHAPGECLPEKLQASFGFADGSWLSLHFWWFGHIHLVPLEDLNRHEMTARLGMDPLCDDFTPVALRDLVVDSRMRIKSLLLDQKRIAGIGNMYSHDILFRAGIHPTRTAKSLSEQECHALWQAIRDTLVKAIEVGGTHWEQNLYGQRGSFDVSCLLVGYKEGQPCPVCGTAIAKINVGNTTSFICPSCQTP